MSKEYITILPKWQLKKKLHYFSFPVEVQRETEKAICVKTLEEVGQFYAGWIPKKVITTRKPY
jgi:ribose 5-phosphate isomerase